ncbi:hypothetical protein LCGC14_2772030, partial [marine sediment metagenome]
AAASACRNLDDEVLENVCSERPHAGAEGDGARPARRRQTRKAPEVHVGVVEGRSSGTAGAVGYIAEDDGGASRDPCAGSGEVNDVLVCERLDCKGQDYFVAGILLGHGLLHFVMRLL